MLRLSQALEELARVYKEEWTDEKLRDIYHRVLGDLPIDDVLIACSTWLCSDSPFFPKPGQLRTLALNLPSSPQAPVSLQARAAQAWINLRSFTIRYNRWALADAVTAQVFRVMGGGYVQEWGFGNWDGKYEEMKRREFETTYVDLARQYSRLDPLPAEDDAQRLMAAQTTGETREGNLPSQEEVRAFVDGLLNQLEQTMSIPPARAYKHGEQKRSHMPLDYTPSLSPTELEARKNLLRRQGHMIIAQELARKEV
mgnify:FL=1